MTWVDPALLAEALVAKRDKIERSDICNLKKCKILKTSKMLKLGACNLSKLKKIFMFNLLSLKIYATSFMQYKTAKPYLQKRNLNTKFRIENLDLKVILVAFLFQIFLPLGHRGDTSQRSR